MKKYFIISLVIISGIFFSDALYINEIMSNPVGDDGGREWIEIYNETDTAVDISTLTISIKGGSAIPVTPLQGGTMLPSHGYAIIGSTVSSATKFLQDYPTYTGLLFKSSIGLVNTGVTSIDIKVNGISTDSVASYTAAKEGFTLSRINGALVTGNPTPGSENQVATEDISNLTSSGSTTSTQGTIAQLSPPSADITLYMPSEKIVVAGQETSFSVFGLTKGGKNIDGLRYVWAYGDGGEGIGSSTVYRYAYPGKYIVLVEGENGYVAGTGRMTVRVVTPDIIIKNISTGKYGNYIDISNPNNYDLDLSQWRISIDGAMYSFPKNTVIAENSVTHVSGVAMGFASTTIATSSVIKILFPNMEEVTRYTPEEKNNMNGVMKNTKLLLSSIITDTNVRTHQPGHVLGVSTSTLKNGSTSQIVVTSLKGDSKDKRIVTFFKSLFSRK